MHDISPPFLALLGLPTFSLVVGLVFVVTIAALVFGVCRWKQPRGKVAAIAAGVVLLLFAVVVLCVLMTVSSGSMG